MCADTAEKFALTKDNYYSLGADRAFMSCSQWDSFCRCEAREAAYLRGEYEKPKGSSTALIVGNYLHAAMEGPDAFESFLDKHWSDIYQVGKRTKKAEFDRADLMIETLRKDSYIGRLIRLPGETEKVMTGVLFGDIPFKIRLDKYVSLSSRMIIDYKTCEDMHETFYSEDGIRESFIEHWGYARRAAAYIEIEKQNAGSLNDAVFLIIAISKQFPPDRDVFAMNDRESLSSAFAGMESRAQHFQRVKDGIDEPIRCERCDYCRATKKITGPRLYTDIAPGRSEGY
ncbi:MAG: PD-(D/E)XK nuclease-like domain-containing protein [Clostridiales bacterium]|nr:PD-(D/E)XK nuclease-like domain-containing protein [Clostridiales bacterium]